MAISTWYCGRRLGLQVVFSSAIVWYLSDKYTHHPYSHSYFIYWEMFMRLISFLTTTLTISRIREMVQSEERLLSDLLRARQELECLNSPMPSPNRMMPTSNSGFKRASTAASRNVLHISAKLTFRLNLEI